MEFKTVLYAGFSPTPLTWLQKVTRTDDATGRYFEVWVIQRNQPHIGLSVSFYEATLTQPHIRLHLAILPKASKYTEWELVKYQFVSIGIISWFPRIGRKATIKRGEMAPHWIHRHLLITDTCQHNAQTHKYSTVPSLNSLPHIYCQHTSHLALFVRSTILTEIFPEGVCHTV